MQNSLSTMPRQEMPLGYNNSLSTDFISLEIRFLIACCQTDQNEENIKLIYSYLNAAHLDLNTLISLANQHGVLPLLYKTLKNLSDTDNLNATRLTPNAFLSELKPYYMSIVQKNMLMTSELINIIKLLRENQIEAIAFKGPPLSQKAYGDITLRQFGDLDILIKRSDVSPMIDLLVAKGYVPQLELDTKLKETFFKALNVIGFYKNTSNILIEMHWELLSKNYAISWDEDALWSQKRESITINKCNIQILPCEEQLLYLCTHGSKHLFERLEWICDIDRSIKAYPNINWQYLLNEAEKRGIKRMLYLGLALCQHFFRLELPELLQENIKQDKKLSELILKVIKSNFSETSTEGKNYSYFILIWNLRENLSEKLRFTWYAFFAPQFDDFKFIQLPSYLAFLYPLVRQFRLVRKYIQH